MTSSHPRTAPPQRDARATLLVFTLSPTGETGRRPLLPARLRGAEIGLRAEWLTTALDAGRRSGCRLVVCSPHPEALPAGARGPEVIHLPQRGGSFGERLADAFESALVVAGGAPVVMVGSDAPGLTPRHVRGALDRLAARPRSVVVGPSRDGGLYLLATTAPIPGLASRVRWCRRGTFASLARLLARGGRKRIDLPPLRDLDRPADLERWLGETTAGTPRWAATVRVLVRALAAWRRPPQPWAIGRPRLAAVAVPASRGPPVALPPTR